MLRRDCPELVIAPQLLLRIAVPLVDKQLVLFPLSQRIRTGVSTVWDLELSLSLFIGVLFPTLHDRDFLWFSLQVVIYAAFQSRRE